MKQTVKKLKSNSGATIVLALLFMLICVFVGGSVLVAATVNGGRLQNERADEQNLLTQRSIATLITAQLSDGGLMSHNFVFEGGTPTNPDTLHGAERALYNSVLTARSSIEHKGTAHFTVSDPVDNSISTACTVSTEDVNNNVKCIISFDNNPKIKLIVRGVDMGGTVSWNSMKAEKGGE